MYLVLAVGIILWLAYELILGDVPLIIANGITLVLAGSVLGLKLRYG